MQKALAVEKSGEAREPEIYAPLEISDYLDSEETIIGYLAALLEEGNPRAFAAGLGDVAKARGMTQVARDAGLSRESLYKALSGDRNPELGTVLGVMRSLGLKLVPAALHPAPATDSGDPAD
jgi:probable addiction module antidote protein